MRKGVRMQLPKWRAIDSSACVAADLEHVDALNERYSLATHKRASYNSLHQYSPSTVAYVLFSVLLLLVLDSKPLMAALWVRCISYHFKNGRQGLRLR